MTHQNKLDSSQLRGLAAEADPFDSTPQGGGTHKEAVMIVYNEGQLDQWLKGVSIATESDTSFSKNVCLPAHQQQDSEQIQQRGLNSPGKIREQDNSALANCALQEQASSNEQVPDSEFQRTNLNKRQGKDSEQKDIDSYNLGVKISGVNKPDQTAAESGNPSLLHQEDHPLPSQLQPLPEEDTVGEQQSSFKQGNSIESNTNDRQSSSAINLQDPDQNEAALVQQAQSVAVPESQEPLLAQADLDGIKAAQQSSFAQDSLAKTDSAKDKPNLKQQFTDPTYSVNGSSFDVQNLVESIEKRESIQEHQQPTVILEAADEGSKNDSDEYMNSFPEPKITPNDNTNPNGSLESNDPFRQEHQRGQEAQYDVEETYTSEGEDETIHVQTSSIDTQKRIKSKDQSVSFVFEPKAAVDEGGAGFQEEISASMVVDRSHRQDLPYSKFDRATRDMFHVNPLNGNRVHSVDSQKSTLPPQVELNNQLKHKEMRDAEQLALAISKPKSLASSYSIGPHLPFQPLQNFLTSRSRFRANQPNLEEVEKTNEKVQSQQHIRRTISPADSPEQKGRKLKLEGMRSRRLQNLQKQNGKLKYQFSNSAHAKSPEPQQTQSPKRVAMQKSFVSSPRISLTQRGAGLSLNTQDRINNLKHIFTEKSANIRHIKDFRFPISTVPNASYELKGPARQPALLSTRLFNEKVKQPVSPQMQQEDSNKRPFSMQNARNRRNMFSALNLENEAEKSQVFGHAAFVQRTDGFQDARKPLQNSYQRQQFKKIDGTETSEIQYGKYELSYSGITHSEMQNLNVLDIYSRMEQMLKYKNKQSIQERYREISDPRNIARVQERIDDGILMSSSPTNIHIESGKYLLSNSSSSVGNQRLQNEQSTKIWLSQTRRNNLSQGRQLGQHDTRGRRIQELLDQAKQKQENDLSEEAREPTFDNWDQKEALWLEKFMSEREKGGEFGHSILFNKVRQNQSLSIEQAKIMTPKQVNELMDLLTEQRATPDFDQEYLQEAHIKILKTLNYIMVEIGMASLYRQLFSEEQARSSTYKHLRLLTRRTQQIYTVRAKLITVFHKLAEQ